MSASVVVVGSGAAGLAAALAAADGGARVATWEFRIRHLHRLLGERLRLDPEAR